MIGDKRLRQSHAIFLLKELIIQLKSTWFSDKSPTVPLMGLGSKADLSASVVMEFIAEAFHRLVHQ
jgi:hypothetical protein